MLNWMKLKKERKKKKSITDEVNDSIMSIKNTVIDTLKEENLKLQNKVKKLEEQLLDIDKKSNHLDQCSTKNNIEVQGIPANVIDDELEKKVLDIFSCLGIEVKGSDMEDCHRLGYANLKNTITKFVNRKFCYQALDKKMELHKTGSKRLGFNPVITYFSKNLTLTNQLLAWKCRELKSASMIHSTWSARRVIRIRRTANERALSSKNDNDLKSLYPDFVFRDR